MMQLTPLQVALAHHLAGRLREAEVIYRATLEAKPDDAVANYLLGVVCHQTSRLREGLPLLERASRLVPAAGDVQNYLSIALRESGRLDDAVEAARRAVAASPAMAEAHVNLGIAMQMRGDLAEAAAAYEGALRVDGNFGAAHNNLGNVLHALGDAAGAERAYRRSIECDPENAGAHNNLASVLQTLGRPDDAVEACRAAIALQPNFAEAYNNLANALRERGDVAEALASYRRAIELRPDYARAYSNYLFSVHFDLSFDAAGVRAEHERWAAAQADPLTQAAPPVHVRERSAGAPLRIGYVSPDFREHAQGRFMLPIVGRHDRARFEVVCYSDARAEDQVTQAIAARADRFVRSAALDDAQLADRIRADGIDLLVGLALHSGRNRLLTFARRPAPVQATYLGYPGTSGMRAMDYRVTDPYLDPPGSAAAAAYTERSIRLPRTYWCYVLPPNVPAVGPLPAGANGYVTFGCLNRFTKVSEAALRTWAELMAGAPGSRLVLHAPPGAARQRVLAIMGESGVAAERVSFVGRQPAVEYLETYNRIDVALDPFPYNGGTTTCEALLMGAAVVTLAGDVAVRRAGASILANAGLPELIARTAAEYAQIAAALAADVARLAELRRTLRERVLTSPLADLPTFVRDLEDVYLAMWKQTVG